MCSILFAGPRKRRHWIHMMYVEQKQFMWTIVGREEATWFHVHAKVDRPAKGRVQTHPCIHARHD